MFSTTVSGIGDFFKAFDRVVSGLETMKSYTVSIKTIAEDTLFEQRAFIDNCDLIQFICNDIIKNYYDRRKNLRSEFTASSSPMSFIYEGSKEANDLEAEDFKIIYTIEETSTLEVQKKLVEDMNRFGQNFSNPFNFIRTARGDLFISAEDQNITKYFRVDKNMNRRSRLDCHYVLTEVEKIDE